jgi:hypothetical protein
VFHEFGRQKLREQWPAEFDMEGVDRDHEIRKTKLQEVQMTQPLSANSFVGGAAIDLNKPPKVAYNPRDHEFPKLLYHQTKKDPNWLAEHKRITLYNSLHPEKPEVLPVVPAAFVRVDNKEQEQKKLAEGFGLRPPSDPEVDEFAAVKGEALCSRGCGNAPHRGACKTS